MRSCDVGNLNPVAPLRLTDFIGYEKNILCRSRCYKEGICYICTGKFGFCRCEVIWVDVHAINDSRIFYHDLGIQINEEMIRQRINPSYQFITLISSKNLILDLLARKYITCNNPFLSFSQYEGNTSKGVLFFDSINMLVSSTGMAYSLQFRHETWISVAIETCKPVCFNLR